MRRNTTYLTNRSLVFGIVLLFCLLTISSLAVVRYVLADYLTTQSAIDASSNGDEIIVSPGTYKENINFKGKNIILRSTDPSNPAVVASTIIDGNKAGPVVTFSGSERPTCVLSGFTITNGYAENGGGIYDEEYDYFNQATIQKILLSETWLLSMVGEFTGAKALSRTMPSTATRLIGKGTAF